MVAKFQTHSAGLSGLPDGLDRGMRETEGSEMTPSFPTKQLEGWIGHTERWEDYRRSRFGGPDLEFGVRCLTFDITVKHSREGIK